MFAKKLTASLSRYAFNSSLFGGNFQIEFHYDNALSFYLSEHNSDTEWVEWLKFANIRTVTVVRMIMIFSASAIPLLRTFYHNCTMKIRWMYDHGCYNLYFCLSLNFMISNCCHCDEFTTTTHCLRVHILNPKYMYDYTFLCMSVCVCVNM